MRSEIALINRIIERFEAGLWTKRYLDVPARHLGIPVPWNFVNDAMACCVVGAVQRDGYKISDDVAIRNTVIQNVQNTLDEIAIDRGYCSIESFNDAPETKLADMIRALQDAQALLARRWGERIL